MELSKLIDGYQVRREDQAFTTAWFVSNMISVHTKHPVPAKELARPFLHEKTDGERERERKAFFRIIQESTRGGGI